MTDRQDGKARVVQDTSDGHTSSKIKPGPRNMAAMEAAVDAYLARPVRVSIRWEQDAAGNRKIGSPHSDEVRHSAQVLSTLGTTSSDFMATSIAALEWGTRDRGAAAGGADMPVNAALAIVGAIEPQNELEAALAIQMAAGHTLTMEMLGRAKSSSQIDHTQLYANLATKMQRTFTAQIEALARMRGKGQQTVRVEHVTVEAGAQAIVGDVHHHGRPGGGASVTQPVGQPYGAPHGAAESQAVAPLPCPDPSGDGVPIPGDAKRTMQAPRRAKSRRAAG